MLSRQIRRARREWGNGRWPYSQSTFVAADRISAASVDAARLGANGFRLCGLGRVVLDGDRIEEGHGRAQRGAHLLDRVLGFRFSHFSEMLAAGLVLFDPLLREGALLNLLEE